MRFDVIPRLSSSGSITGRATGRPRSEVSFCFRQMHSFVQEVMEHSPHPSSAQAVAQRGQFIATFPECSTHWFRAICGRPSFDHRAYSKVLCLPMIISNPGINGCTLQRPESFACTTPAGLNFQVVKLCASCSSANSSTAVFCICVQASSESYLTTIFVSTSPPQIIKSGDFHHILRYRPTRRRIITECCIQYTVRSWMSHKQN